MAMDLFRPGGLELTARAADMIKLRPGDKLLDIGCGLGTSLAFLKEAYGIEPWGVDINPRAVEKAAQRIGTDTLYCADACVLPFEDGSFQAVFMECVLTLVPEPERALKEAVRVLAPGGHLVISSLDGATVGLCAQGRIGRAELQAQLRLLGMEVLSLSDETLALRRFVAEIIFSYDSLENYIDHAKLELGGSVLSCDVPVKQTGYALLVSKKPENCMEIC